MKIGKFKLYFYLSSGSVFTLKCKKFELTKLSSSKGKRELKIEGCKTHWSIDIDEIIAIKSKWVLF